MALFVDDRDPLIFYKAIAGINSGTSYVEVHEEFAVATAELFTSAEIRTDMQGKPRMIRGIRG